MGRIVGAELPRDISAAAWKNMPLPGGKGGIYKPAASEAGYLHYCQGLSITPTVPEM